MSSKGNKPAGGPRRHPSSLQVDRARALKRLENLSKTTKVGTGSEIRQIPKKTASGVRPIQIGHFTLLDDGMEVDGRPPIEEYAEVGVFIVHVEKASSFWLGDWVRYGNSRPDWEERLAQAQDLSGYSLETIKRYKQVAENIPRSRRRVHELSFRHHMAVESLDAVDQVKMLDEAIENGWSVADLKKEVTALRRRGILSGQAEIAGMFRVWLVDFPWIYGNHQPSGTSAQTHYPGMTIEEGLKMGAVVQAHTMRDAVGFFWVTAPMLYEQPGPNDLIRGWGFEPKTGIVWDKVEHNFGNYVSVRHEHLIIATRGSCLPDRPTPMIDSVFTERRSDIHSEKPEGVRTIIERLYDGPYVELFARRPIPNWTTWGNQILEEVVERETGGRSQARRPPISISATSSFESASAARVEG